VKNYVKAAETNKKMVLLRTVSAKSWKNSWL
jgi:hypothetical protein